MTSNKGAAYLVWVFIWAAFVFIVLDRSAGLPAWASISIITVAAITSLFAIGIAARKLREVDDDN